MVPVPYALTWAGRKRYHPGVDWNNASTSSGFGAYFTKSFVERIEARVRVYGDPRRCRSGVAIEGAAEVSFTALGLLITGTRIGVLAWPSSIPGNPPIEIWWAASLTQNPAPVLDGLRIQVAAIFWRAVDDMIKQQERAGRNLADEWREIGLDTPAGEDEARSAYRESAKSAHPDVGGSHERMVRIGQAWERICAAMHWDR